MSWIGFVVLFCLVLLGVWANMRAGRWTEKDRDALNKFLDEQKAAVMKRPYRAARPLSRPQAIPDGQPPESRCGGRLIEEYERDQIQSVE